MALSKYVKGTTPRGAVNRYVDDELRRVQLALDSIVNYLDRFESGANDSAGPGYKWVIVPNSVEV